MKQVIEITNSIVYIEDTHDYSIIRIPLLDAYVDVRVGDTVEIYSEDEKLKIKKSKVQKPKLVQAPVMKKEIIIETVKEEIVSVIDAEKESIDNNIDSLKTTIDDIKTKKEVNNPIIVGTIIFTVVALILAFAFSTMLESSYKVLDEMLLKMESYLPADNINISGAPFAFLLLLSGMKLVSAEEFFSYLGNWSIPILTITILLYFVPILAVKKYLKKFDSKKTNEYLLISCVAGLLVLSIIGIFISSPVSIIGGQSNYEQIGINVEMIPFSLIANALPLVLLIYLLFFFDFKQLNENDMMIILIKYVITKVKIMLAIILGLLFILMVVNNNYTLIYALGNMVVAMPIIIFGGQVNTAVTNFQKLDLLFLLESPKYNLPNYTKMVILLMCLSVFFVWFIDAYNLKKKINISDIKLSLMVGSLSGLLITIIAYTGVASLHSIDAYLSFNLIKINGTSYIIVSILISVLTYIRLVLKDKVFDFDIYVSKVKKLFGKKTRKGELLDEKKV